MAPATTWRKSSYSGGNGGACVEVAHGVNRLLVRDSKNPEGPVLDFGAVSFSGFLARLKQA